MVKCGVNGMNLDKTLKLTIIIGVLAVSLSAVYHFVIRPEVTQRRSERLFRECLGTTVNLEGDPTQGIHSWLIEMCVKSGGIDELLKLKQELGVE